MPINFKLDEEEKKISFKEVEELKLRVEREVEAIRASGIDMADADSEDPWVVNPKKDLYQIKDKNLTLTQIVTKLTNGEGVEMEVAPIEVSSVQ